MDITEKLRCPVNFKLMQASSVINSQSSKTYYRNAYKWNFEKRYKFNIQFFLPTTNNTHCTNKSHKKEKNLKLPLIRAKLRGESSTLVQADIACDTNINYFISASNRPCAISLFFHILPVNFTRHCPDSLRTIITRW